MPPPEFFELVQVVRIASRLGYFHRTRFGTRLPSKPPYLDVFHQLFGDLRLRLAAPDHSVAHVELDE